MFKPFSRFSSSSSSSSSEVTSPEVTSQEEQEEVTSPAPKEQVEVTSSIPEEVTSPAPFKEQVVVTSSIPEEYFTPACPPVVKNVVVKPRSREEQRLVDINLTIQTTEVVIQTEQVKNGILVDTQGAIGRLRERQQTAKSLIKTNRVMEAEIEADLEVLLDVDLYEEEEETPPSPSSPTPEEAPPSSTPTPPVYLYWD